MLAFFRGPLSRRPVSNGSTVHLLYAIVGYYKSANEKGELRVTHSRLTAMDHAHGWGTLDGPNYRRKRSGAVIGILMVGRVSSLVVCKTHAQN